MHADLVCLDAKRVCIGAGWFCMHAKSFCLDAKSFCLDAGPVLPNAKYDVGKSLPAPSNEGAARPILLPHAA